MTAMTQADVGAFTIRADLLRTIKRYSALAETATLDTTARYREDRKRKKALIDRLSGNYGSKDAKHPLKTRSMAMSWREFYAEVAAEGADRLVNRLDVLARSREAFARGVPFNQRHRRRLRHHRGQRYWLRSLLDGGRRPHSGLRLMERVEAARRRGAGRLARPRRDDGCDLL